MKRVNGQPPHLRDVVEDPCQADQLNCSSDNVEREERRRRALSIVGAFSSGVDDLSVNHDHYLAEAYANAADDE
ncbi:MAG: hypothetical protein OXF54_04915 [Caldilineaceae bacterium]|nr:hypothetical protein [Caldilineaceae bacterium]